MCFSNIEDAESTGLNVEYVMMMLILLPVYTVDSLISLSCLVLYIILTLGLLSILSRLLSKDGKLLMWEPMATNPFINLYRHFTPNLRTADEHPLTFKDLTYIKNLFLAPNLNYMCLHLIKYTYSPYNRYIEDPIYRSCCL